MRHVRIPGRADVAFAELVALCCIEPGGHLHCSTGTRAPHQSHDNAKSLSAAGALTEHEVRSELVRYWHDYPLEG